MSNKFKIRKRRKSNDYIFNDKAQRRKIVCTEDEILRSALIVCDWDHVKTEEFLIKHGGEDNTLKERLLSRLKSLQNKTFDKVTNLK